MMDISNWFSAFLLRYIHGVDTGISRADNFALNRVPVWHMNISSNIRMGELVEYLIAGLFWRTKTFEFFLLWSLISRVGLTENPPNLETRR